MKVLQIAILRFQRDCAEPVMLASACDLSSFGFFEKSGRRRMLPPSVREMLTVFSKIIVKRIKPGQRSTVEQDQMQDYQVHAFVRADGLCGTVTADKEYPARAAFAMLGEAMDKFAKACTCDPLISWILCVKYTELDQTIVQCQDPSNFDKIVKIQKDLDETTLVLHQTIDNLLERGEKLDNLVERSDDLSKQSKLFYKQARKTNSCCVIA